MTKDYLSNDEKIVQYLHCGLCAEENKNCMYPGESPKTMQRIQVGWTKEGIQVWCVRHECNVIHIDFQGAKHPANLTRKATKEEMSLR